MLLSPVFLSCRWNPKLHLYIPFHLHPSSFRLSSLIPNICNLLSGLSTPNWFSPQSILNPALLDIHFFTPQRRAPSWLNTVNSSSLSQSIPISLCTEPCFVQSLTNTLHPRQAGVLTQIPHVWDVPHRKYFLTYPHHSLQPSSNHYATHNSRPPSWRNHSDFPVQAQPCLCLPSLCWVMLRIRANRLAINCSLIHSFIHLFYRNILSTYLCVWYFANYSNFFTSLSFYSMITCLANKMDHALSFFPDSSVPSRTVGISSSPLTPLTSNINWAASAYSHYTPHC